MSWVIIINEFNAKIFLLKVKFELEWNLAYDNRVINIEIWSSSQIGKRFAHQCQYYRKKKTPKKQKTQREKKKKNQIWPKTWNPHKSFKWVDQTFERFGFYRVGLLVTLNSTQLVLCSPLLISLGHNMTRSPEASSSVYHIINSLGKWDNLAKGWTTTSLYPQKKNTHTTFLYPKKKKCKYERTHYLLLFHFW